MLACHFNNQNFITLHLHLNDCLSLDSQSKLLTSLTLSELSIIGHGEKSVQWKFKDVLTLLTRLLASGVTRIEINKFAFILIP